MATADLFSPLTYPTVPDEAVIGAVYEPSPYTLEFSALRLHWVALSNWLNQHIRLPTGQPVPVINATPMDAFSQFDKLWNAQNSPFAYLRSQETPGTPSVYPVDQRYPLISVDSRGMRYVPERSYGSRVFRRIFWPVSDSPGTPGVTLSSLAHVAQARMPLAFDYRYRIDMWSMRPDTQAFLVEQFIRAMKASAAQLQAYIHVLYPMYMGRWLVKTVAESDIEDSTEKSPIDQPMRYRSTVDIAMQGWRADTRLVITPTLWAVNTSVDVAVSPEDLAQVYVLNSYDMRPYQRNPVLALRANLPPGTVVGSVIQGTVW